MINSAWITTALFLPICSKILEKLLFNEKFRFFTTNYLRLQQESGFKLSDSCANQLLSITYEIYKLFDEAFDKVWHNVTLFKIKQNGISDNFLNLYLMFRHNVTLFKIKQNGISDNFLNLYLMFRHNVTLFKIKQNGISDNFLNLYLMF